MKDVLFAIAFVAAGIMIFFQLKKNKETARAIEEVRVIKKNTDIVVLIDSIHNVREKETIDSIKRLKATVDSMKSAQRIENTKLRNRNAALEKRVSDLDRLVGERPDF